MPLDPPYDLEGNVSTFVMAFTTIIHKDEFDDLGERYSLVDESVKALSKLLPCSNQRRAGSPLGNVLRTFPSGMQIYNDGSLHAAKLQRTIVVRAPFLKQLEQFSRYMASVAGSLLTCTGELVDALCNVAKQIGIAWFNELQSNVVEDFIPTVNSVEVSGPVQLWFEKSYAAAMELLQPVLNAEVDVPAAQT